jgi:hypothetical protein
MGLKISAPLSTSVIDSSGETVLIEGANIDAFNEGRAFANYEHQSKSSEDIIGIFRFAKKIFSEKDCDTDDQKKWWKAVKLPFIYTICELFDDDQSEKGHAGAVAVAAMINFFANKKEKIMVGISTEGQTLERENNELIRTNMTCAALTLKPCNKQCWVDLINEKDMDFLKKTEYDSLKSYSFEIDSAILNNPLEEIQLLAADLNKTLTAGMGNVAPSALTGGAALQVEDRNLRNKMKATFRDWDRTRPLKEVMKAALPEISDAYIDHFIDVAKEISLKKSQPLDLERIDNRHSPNQAQDDEQKKLLEGLYFDKAKKFDPNSKLGQKRFNLLKLRNDSGDHVIVKENHLVGEDATKSAKNASNYYHLAKNYFHMADHVPVTNHFVRDGRLYSAMQYLKGSKPAFGKAHKDVAAKSFADGSLHKLIAMDMITGHPDRHLGNVLIHDDKLKHVDNDEAFEYRGVFPHEHLPDQNPAQEMLHPKASEWLKNLNNKGLALHLAKMQLPAHKIKTALFALAYMKKNHGNQTLGQMQEAINNTAQSNLDSNLML